MPFVYETEDQYWNIITTFTPPTGCTSDVPSQEVSVADGMKSSVFTLTCDTSVLSQAGSGLTAQVGASVSSAAKASVRHNVKDCTKTNPAGQTVCQSQTGSSVIDVLKAAGKKAGKGLSLWSVVKERLGNPSNDQIKAAVKAVATKNQIAIPEWGINGTISSRALSASALSSLNW